MLRRKPDLDAIVEAVRVYRRNYPHMGPTFAEIGNNISPERPFSRSIIHYYVTQLLEAGRLEATFAEGRMVARSLRLPTPRGDDA